jgi:hypothetical protein
MWYEGNCICSSCVVPEPILQFTLGDDSVVLQLHDAQFTVNPRFTLICNSDV